MTPKNGSVNNAISQKENIMEIADIVIGLENLDNAESVEQDLDNQVTFFVFPDNSVIRENTDGRIVTTRYREVKYSNDNKYITYIDTAIDLKIVFRSNDSSGTTEWKIWNIEDPNIWLSLFDNYNENNDHNLYYDLKDLWLDDIGPTI